MSRYETDIAPLKRRFCFAAALFLVTAMACVSQIRSRRLLEKTHDELVRAKAGLVRVREAGATRRNTLEMLKNLQMHGAANTSAERRIYGKIDELNTRLKPDELTISAIERKGDEVLLQYSFKFINPNYNDFLNTVNYLEGSVFPLTTVNAVAITQAEAGGKKMLACSVNGKVLTSEKQKP